MGWYSAVGRPAFLALPPEAAHRVANALLGLPLAWRHMGGVPDDPALRTSVAGIELRNPIGLAAGFDKTCAHLDALGRLGFGYVVGGTITRAPRRGNPKPRIVRYPDRASMVNAMGLPNPGAAAAAAALARTPRTTSRWVSLADEELPDALTALDLVAPHADAIELNASSPNAGWSHRADHTARLTSAFTAHTDLPIFVKVPTVADDASLDGVLTIAAAAVASGARGLTCGNTLPVEDARMSTGRGGLSGGPLTERTPSLVAELRAVIPPDVAINACGGIFGVADARACVDAGAQTVQIYTGLIYEGPRIAARVARGLGGS